MGDGYVIKNVLVWTASKLGNLAAQLAKQHVDIIDMVYTGCLDYATPRGGPTVFLGGFDFYAILSVLLINSTNASWARVISLFLIAMI